jgi:hypothetical protein
MEPYFVGRKLVKSGQISYKNGKAGLDYRIFHHWENILTSGAKCGARESYSVSRTIGFSQEHKQALQAAVNGTLGVGALLKFEGQLASETALTIKWDIEEKTERQFEFTAPACGEYIAVRYQLLREYELKYTDSSWFHDKGWELHITERLDFFHDGSQVNKNDPACGCKNQLIPPVDGLMEAVAKNFSFWLTFNKADNGLNLYLSGVRATVMPERPYAFRLHVPSAYIAPDLLFLANESRKTVDTTVTLIAARDGAEIHVPTINDVVTMQKEMLGAQSLNIFATRPDLTTTPRFRIAVLAEAIVDQVAPAYSSHRTQGTSKARE